MTGHVRAILIFLGGIITGVITSVIGELVNEEIRGWLECVPHVILRLAARGLDPARKITIYEDEWLPELTDILKRAEARPITRLITGTTFALGLLITTNRIARHLHRAPSSPSQAQPAHAEAASLISRQERPSPAGAVTHDQLPPLGAGRHAAVIDALCTLPSSPRTLLVFPFRSQRDQYSEDKIASALGISKQAVRKIDWTAGAWPPFPAIEIVRS